jgi:hypothetical protein
VFAALWVKVTVTPAGTFMVVKLNTPVSGKVVWTVQGIGVQVGLKGPSAPVLPLENACAPGGQAIRPTSRIPAVL